MDTNTISTDVLTGLVLTLTALHNAGVKLGHFNGSDFLTLAEEVAAAVLPILAKPASTPTGNAS